MKKNIAFLLLIISIHCNSQNTTSPDALNTIKIDSIKICPFETNCGYYIGEVANRKANGKGKAILRGGIAEGNWSDSRLEGYGSYDSKDVGKYVGEYKNGALNGNGTFTNINGSKYVGEWKNNLFYGHGTFFTPDGKKYVGKWSDGKPKEPGFITFAKGLKFSKETKDAKFTGQGTRISQNGAFLYW